MGTTDILKAVICCGVLLIVTLTWLRFSSRTLIALTIRQSFAIAVRIILVHLIIVPILCIGGGIPIDYFAFAAVIILLLMPAVTLDNIPGDGMGILAVTILPLYVIKQFVLGFPDRGKVVLEPPLEHPRNIQNRRMSAQASEESASIVVVAPLKPYGYIELNGERLAAISVDGSLIDNGKKVRICGRRDQAVLVQIVETRDS